MNAPTTSVPQLITPQQVDVFTDTRDILAHARQDSIKRKYRDWFICDVDAHHVETVSWKEIIAYIEDPVVREQAIHFQAERITPHPTASTAISACATRASAAASRIRTGNAKRSRKATSIAMSC